MSAAVKAGPHFTVLGEVRTENLGQRPTRTRCTCASGRGRRATFDIQVGRVPPTFGAFARRTYASDNPLIGYPLAYQYLTSLRPDALAGERRRAAADARPRLAAALLGRQPGRRAAACRSSAPSAGTPASRSTRTDGMLSATGVGDRRARCRTRCSRDDNGGRQVAGRVELRPVTGLIVGASLARGPFVGRDAARAASGDVADGHDGEFTQTAWGGDVEYSRDHYLLRFETIVSDWRLPVVGAPALPQPLGALSTSIEGRYKLRPGLYAAARFDHLGFSEVAGTPETLPWDAPVTRVEVGGGYSLQRNLLLKLSYQHNTPRRRRAGSSARIWPPRSSSSGSR